MESLKIYEYQIWHKMLLKIQQLTQISQNTIQVTWQNTLNSLYAIQLFASLYNVYKIPNFTVFKGLFRKDVNQKGRGGSMPKDDFR